MTALFRKLNLKDQRRILVVGSPESFEPEIAALDSLTVVRDAAGESEIDFALAFVTNRADLNRLANHIVARARGDAVIWFAYPKKSSRKYVCDFNRDTGWHVLGDAGFEGVRQVAIDEDWSALRFRRTEYVKRLSRDQSRAISTAGKTRAVERDTRSDR